MNAFPKGKNVIGLFFVFLLFSVVSAPIALLLKPIMPMEWMQLIIYVVSVGGLVLLYYSIKNRKEGGYRFSFKKPTFNIFVLSTIGGICMVFITDALSMLLPEPPDFFMELYSQMVSPHFATIFCTVICAPFLEEMLCRGIVADGLLKHISPTKAIIYSALFFALIHLNPWQALGAFCLGLFFAWVYWKTSSLFIPIWLHFVNNASSCIVSQEYGLDIKTIDLMPIGVYISIIVLSLIILPCVIKAISNQLCQEYDNI